jgi:hypothetical protein
LAPGIAFALGFAGAVVVELRPVYELRKDGNAKWPDWLRLRSYWAISTVGFVIGGAVAAGYSTSTKLSWYMALNVGAAWPVILGGIAGAAPSIKPDPDQSR